MVIRPQTNFQIGGRQIRQGKPAYVIAEIGVNHQGELTRALDLIDSAAQAGADAVKFQKRHLPSLYVPEVLNELERCERGYQYLLPILKRVELEPADYEAIIERCSRLGVQFLCTPFDHTSADLVERLGVPAFKVASCDLTNLNLIDHLCKKKLPLILSTGAASEAELDRTVIHLQELEATFALLHCNSTYPTAPEDVGLKRLERLSQYGVPVGYSGHDRGGAIAVAAVALGASIIEKHITYDRNANGPDHRASLEPDEFTTMVRDIREVEKALGPPKASKRVSQGEVMNREILGKSLVAARPITEGQVISNRDLTVKSPAKGLSPQRINDAIGARARRSIPQDGFITEADLDGLPLRPELTCTPPGNWGLVVRYDDAMDTLQHGPRTLEFHLTDQDLMRAWTPPRPLDCALLVHCPEYDGDRLSDLAALDEKTRRNSVNQALMALDRLSELVPFFEAAPTPSLVIHAGGMSLDPLTPKQKAQACRAFDRSHEKLRAAADERGLLLLVENLPPRPWYFGGTWISNVLCSAQDVMEFTENQGATLCFDTSHAGLQCNFDGTDLADFAAAVAPHTRHLHLSDARGINDEGMPVGEGDIDWPRVLAPFAPGSGWTGTWVPEVWRGHQDGGRGFLLSLEQLTRHFEAAAALRTCAGAEQRHP